MYIYINAMAATLEEPNDYIPVALADVPFYIINQTYADVVFTITNTFFQDNHEVALYWEDIPQQVKSLTTTITQWFTSIGNAALTTRDIPDFDPTGYLYSYAPWASDMLIDITNLNFHPDADLTRDEKEDIIIRHVDNDLDYAHIAATRIASVNGVLYPLQASPYGVYIKGAGKDAAVYNDNGIRLYAFDQMADITIYPLRDATVFNPIPANSMTQTTYLNFGGDVDLSSRTLLLVFGGRIHLLDDILKLFNSHSVYIDTSKIDLASLYYELEKRIDVSGLPVVKTDKDGLQVASLLSDEFIAAILNMEQSFIIALDNGEYHVEDIFLEPKGIPGRYYIGTLYEGLLLGQNGFVLEYNRTYEDKMWVLSTTDYLNDIALRNTTDWQDQPVINGRNVSRLPVVLNTVRLARFFRTDPIS